MSSSSSSSSKQSGIGLVLSDGLSGFYVLQVVPDGPAARCGQIAIHDKLSSVNGISVKGLELEALYQNMIAGEDGTKIALTFLRHGEEYTVELERRSMMGAGRTLSCMENIHASFMLKQKPFGKRSKKRWFVLGYTNFYYQEDAFSVTPIGSIDFMDLVDVQSTSNDGFIVKCSRVTFRDGTCKANRTLKLIAESPKDADKWVQLLKERCPGGSASLHKMIVAAAPINDIDY